MNDEEITRKLDELEARLAAEYKANAAIFTPSDAVPPDEPAEHDPSLVTDEDLALAGAAADVEGSKVVHACFECGSPFDLPEQLRAAEERAQEEVKAVALALSRVEQERDEARRDVAQLNAMVRALSKGGAGTAASVLLTRGPEGSLFVVIAPTLDEAEVARLIGAQIADANTAREQGYREAMMKAACAAFRVDEVDTEDSPTLHGLLDESFGEDWRYDDATVSEMRSRRDAADEAEMDDEDEP